MKKPNKYYVEKRISRVFFYLGIIIICIIAVFPLYWMIIGSIQPKQNFFDYPPQLIPLNITLSNYTDIILSKPIFGWIANSLIVAIGAVIITLIFTIPAAHSLSRFKYRGKNILAFIILSAELLPSVLILIPLFMIFLRLKLYDSLFSLIIVNVGLSMPFCIWVLKGFFDTIPREIEEASRIDGCNEFQILFRIILPLSYPAIITISTLTFLTAWDEFMFSMTLISNRENWVASVGLKSFFGQLLTPWGQVMAASVFFTIPVLILFAIFQKYIISGLTGGAIKG